MVIVTEFKGDQKSFHHFWCPLMYKHQECSFYIKGEFIFPKDLKNLHINKEPKGGPILNCPIDYIPTYKAMIELQAKPKGWNGDHVKLGAPFYDTMGQLQTPSL